MNLILCGLPRAGKTTVGALLAKELNRPFIDTDVLIETAYAHATGKALLCAEIYRHEGAGAFRYLEKKAVFSLKGTQDAIISVGGGALEDDGNRRFLKALGKLLYLKVDTGVLLERILADKIPAFYESSEQFQELIDRREPLYEAAADASIFYRTESPEELVHQIQEMFHGQ